MLSVLHLHPLQCVVHTLSTDNRRLTTDKADFFTFFERFRASLRMHRPSARIGNRISQSEKPPQMP